ncbi:beta-1,4-glucuronyltransferase 1-like [Patiria miniata]|uniref:Beta-1,4-glucuronyltransferase 1 n=1 Tax=Patiria miniata TaxID=46514 RepID=A0A914BBF6_PATMI|nr:beta-1,4-glucuronyltransferase 1-like [Patiria miniata]
MSRVCRQVHVSSYYWSAGKMRLTVVRAMVGGLVSVLIILQLIHLSMISWLENKATAITNGRRSAGSGSLPSRNNHSLRSRTKIHLEAKLDTTGSYKIYHSYMKSTAAVSRKTHEALPSDVTLITQCSVNNLYHLVDLVVRWQGPMSVAVFSVGPDISTFNNILFTLRECFPGIKENVTFHLVQPITEITETLSSSSAKALPFTKLPCETILSSLKEQTFQATSQTKNYALQVPYPNNVLRNVARSGADSRFVFVIDIDMLPSAHLRTQFLHLSRSSIILQEETEYSKRTAFVVPAFEIQKGEEVPRTKERLVLDAAMYGRIRPFYVEDCPHCHNHTDYHRWERSKGTPGAVNIAYTVEWKPMWEPFYIGHRDVPLYDERFKQYGFNRISQVCEMHVAGYNFAVLDTAFLIHKGFKEKSAYHAHKLQENRRNKELFLHFQEELKVKYPESSKRCQT